MLGIGNKSNQVYSPNNQKSHGGLAIGTGVAAVSGGVIAAAPKCYEKLADKVIRSNAAEEYTNNVVMHYLNAPLRSKNTPDLSKAVLADFIANTKERNAALVKEIKSLLDLKKDMKSFKPKKALIQQLPLYIASGAIVDYANNRQRAKSEPNATTKNGNDYVKVNMGKKLGAVLGLACQAISFGLGKAAKTLPKGQIAQSMVVSAIGGYALGALADRISNKKAAKAADKNA